MSTTTVSAEWLTKALETTPFELSAYLRGFAADKLTALAGEIRQGRDSIHGDVDDEDVQATVEGVLNLLHSAQACDEVWRAEMDAQA